MCLLFVPVHASAKILAERLANGVGAAARVHGHVMLEAVFDLPTVRSRLVRCGIQT
jgi:hypothetical protein